MKTLHLTNAWHSRSGGIQTFYRALLAAAEAAGHEMVLVVPGERDRMTPIGAHTRIHEVAAEPAPFNRAYRMIRPGGLGFNRRVRDILREEAPDLIEINDKYSLHYHAGMIRRGWLPEYEGRPTLVGISCERMDENFSNYLPGWPGREWFCRWYMKWVYFGFFDHHVTVSAHTAAELREASRGHVRSRGVWIRPMGVDLGSFTPDLRDEEFRAHLCLRTGGNENSRLMLYAGRLAPEKNLGLLVETLVALQERATGDNRLLVAGDGMERETLERELRQRAPGTYAFLGHMEERRELARLYASADVFVHPNPEEPFGIAPLEAMASGLPLVGPASGGILTYANGGNAWLGEPRGAQMAELVEQVFAEPAARRERVKAALSTAGEFDWPVVARQFLELYSELAETSGQASARVLRPDFESTPGDWLGVEQQ